MYLTATCIVIKNGITTKQICIWHIYTCYGIPNVSNSDLSVTFVQN